MTRTSLGRKPTVADMIDYSSPHNAVDRGCATQMRFYSMRSSTRASEVPSDRDKFFNSSFNGPKLIASEPFDTAVTELTNDRIKR